MFRIGDFSRFGRVSVKMLRHYDDLGLLKPAHTDPQTGYRYYTADQLPRLNRVIALKDLGFTLEQIASALENGLPPERLRGMLMLKRAEVEQRLADEQARLTRIEARLRQIEQEAVLPVHDVVLRHVEPQVCATLRRVIPQVGKNIEQMFETLETVVAGFHARASAAPLSLWHDPDYRTENLDVEAAVPVTRQIPDTDGVATRTVPGGAMACMVYTGAYKTLDTATQTLLTWIEAHRYRINGATREVYLRFGAQQEAYTLPASFLAHHSDEYVTELQIPIITIEQETP